MEVQCQLTGFLGADMFRNLVNIVHQTDRIAESIGIDILHQERLGFAFRQHKINFISTVHVAHLNGLVTEIIIFDSEESADFQQLVMKVHVSSPLCILVFIRIILPYFCLFVNTEPKSCIFANAKGVTAIRKRFTVTLLC